LPTGRIKINSFNFDQSEINLCAFCLISYVFRGGENGGKSTTTSVSNLCASVCLCKQSKTKSTSNREIP